MAGKLKLLIFLILFCAIKVNAQDTILFRGQLSSWAAFNSANQLPLWIGGHYIPQLNFSQRKPKNRLFDSELSINIYGNAGFHPFDSVLSNAKIRPYRAWIRYSGNQFELRLGLQKINFGSALMLRPLMWFDQMDPRDPLHLTDGVYGLLFRYYFLNNSNLWLWGLYGNNKPRGWELVPVNKKFPEFGGRLQVPLPRGEAAISFNHRLADNRGLSIFDNHYDKIPEERIGLDAKWDLKVGFWIEGSWTRKGYNLGLLTNQEIFNTGFDYTFGLGKGLYLAYEQLLISFDQRPFRFKNKTLFSLLTINYPVGPFDKLSGITYFDWTKNKIYNFVSWQKQFDNIILYIMGYLNPEFNQLPALSTGSTNLFSGKGIQVMLVFNH